MMFPGASGGAQALFRACGMKGTLPARLVMMVDGMLLVVPDDRWSLERVAGGEWLQQEPPGPSVAMAGATIRRPRNGQEGQEGGLMGWVDSWWGGSDRASGQAQQ